MSHILFLFTIFTVLLASVLAVTADGEETCTRIVPVRYRKDRILITEFGGVGDGNTDNTRAFREAIYRIERLKRRGGTELYVPSGVYLTGSFNLTSHMTLFLAGGAVIRATQVNFMKAAKMEIPSAELDLMGAVSSSQLPADVMMEILIRLPVKSVLRFKSVCRAWNALSNNPLFIKLHCQMAVTSSNKSPVLRLLVHTRDSSELHHVLSVLLHPPYDQPIIRKLNPPIEYSSYSLDVVGSINGVVCLNLSDHAGCILLWNPATRKHYQIPRPALVLTYDERVTLGFGYDTKSNSFKVVRVVYAKHFSANMQRARIEVYSTQTNSWSSKGSDDLPWLCYQKRCSIIVRGSPYWYAVELQQQGSIFRELVAWFDMDSERFFFHTLPYYSNFSSFRIQLGVLEGNPAVAVYSTGSDPDRKVEIWMLDKYGSSGRDNNEMTWVRKFSINPIVGVEKVVGCGKNCEILAEDQDGVLYVYNPSPTKIKDLPHYRSWGFTDVYDHVESLVAVSPSTEA